MIIFDTPSVWKEKYGPSAHLMSTLSGAEGTRELKEFAKKIGLKPYYIQKPGTEYEHFDIFKSGLEKAQKAGAKQVTRRELVEAIRKKRTAVTSSSLAVDEFFK